MSLSDSTEQLISREVSRLLERGDERELLEGLAIGQAGVSKAAAQARGSLEAAADILQALDSRVDELERVRDVQRNRVDALEDTVHSLRDRIERLEREIAAREERGHRDA